MFAIKPVSLNLISNKYLDHSRNHSREVSFQEVNEEEASNFFAAYFLEGHWNGLLLGTDYLAKLSLQNNPSYFFAHPLLLLCSSPLTSLLIPPYFFAHPPMTSSHCQKMALA
jgi:hypothetical protein